MTEDGGRPQDQGRAHRKAGRPSAATLSLLADYQQAMRDELRQLLEDVAPKPPTPAPMADALGVDRPPAARPSLSDRTRIWDLAIKLGRELGTEVDATPATPATAPRRPRARGRVDYGPNNDYLPGLLTPRRKNR